MNQRFLAGLIAFAAVLVVGPAAGQTPSARAPAPDASDAPPPVPTAGDVLRGPLPLFYLRDGSQVAGRPGFVALEVKTRYGVLTIPQDELVRVRFARRVDPAVRARVEALVTELGDDDFDTRENAMESLRQIGASALPLLRDAIETGGEEVRNRAEILVEEIDEEQAAGKESSESGLSGIEGKDDEVVTTRMTIRGRVLASRVAIVSRYGPLGVDVADLNAIAFQRSGPTQRSVEVLPTFQPPGNWYDTKMDVAKGQGISIEASGMVSVSNYGVSSGPAGTTQWSGSSFGNFPMLSLVGKVGKKGKPFLVGASYRGRADREGRFYLGIVAFVHNPGGAAGKYEVKVKALAAR